DQRKVLLDHAARPDRAGKRRKVTPLRQLVAPPTAGVPERFGVTIKRVFTRAQLKGDDAISPVLITDVRRANLVDCDVDKPPAKNAAQGITVQNGGQARNVRVAACELAVVIAQQMGLAITRSLDHSITRSVGRDAREVGMGGVG